MFNGSLDANVVLRLILNDIPKQYVAAKRLIENSQKQFAVSDTALIEVVFALDRYYNLTRPQVRELILGFMSLKQINSNRIMFDNALDLYESAPSLSLEDCAIATYAKLNKALPLYTFDKKLASHSPDAKLLPL